MNNSKILNCKVGLLGGSEGVSAIGIGFDGGHLTINGGEISGCGTTLEDGSFYGGAISAFPFANKGYVSITDTTIKNNHSIYGGGIVLAYDCDFTIKNVTFDNNTSEKDGGALFISGENVYYNLLPTGSVEECLFSDNSGRYGGAIYVEETSLSLSDSIVLHNNAVYGGGLFKNSPSMTLTGINIICNNTASSGGADIFNDNGTLDLSSASAMRQTFQSTSFVIDGWYSDASPRWSESRDTYLGDSYSVTGRKGLIAAYTPYDEIEVVKIWNDGNNLLKKRPESLTVTLTDASGNPIKLRTYNETEQEWTDSGEDAKVTLTTANADSSDPNKWVGSIGPLLIADYSDAATYKLQEDVGGG